jgi:hypothetical protein
MNLEAVNTYEGNFQTYLYLWSKSYAVIYVPYSY